MLSYRATIPGLSTAHLRHLTAVLRRHRATIGSRWRKLPPARQALLVLAHLRCGDTFAQLANSFTISATTVYRYISEAIDLLAAAKPDLDQVLSRRTPAAATILDGTIIPSFRVRWTSQHKQWYAQRKKTYGINLQALTDEHGNLLWLSDSLPGSTHDLTAARGHGIIEAAHRHQVRLWADKGYIGEAPTVITPVKADAGKELLPCTKAYNRSHARKRAIGERGFATLKTWRILHRIRCTVSKTGAIAQAILVLHHATSTNIRLK